MISSLAGVTLSLKGRDWPKTQVARLSDTRVGRKPCLSDQVLCGHDGRPCGASTAGGRGIEKEKEEGDVEEGPLDVSDTLDPRIGWIEAFLAVSECRSYDAAVGTLGITSSAIERRILKLELWLRRLLVMSGVPVELAPDAEEFKFIAEEILQLFLEHDSRLASNSTGNKVCLRKSKKSLLRLSQIDDFIALSTAKGYERAVAMRKGKVDVIRDSRSALEKSLGRKLVAGHGYIHLLEDGQRFLISATKISDMLHEFRHDITDRSILRIPREFKILRKAVERKRQEFKSTISIIERAAVPTRTRKRQLSESKKFLAVLDGVALELDGVDFNANQDEFKKVLPMLLGILGLKK